MRRGTDCQLRRAALVPSADGGYAADFGEGEEMLTLERALRCCESLPGDGGWPINWDAVAAIAQHSAPPLQQHKILRFYNVTANLNVDVDNLITFKRRLLRR